MANEDVGGGDEAFTRRRPHYLPHHPRHLLDHVQHEARVEQQRHKRPARENKIHVDLQFLALELLKSIGQGAQEGAISAVKLYSKKNKNY